MGQCIYTVDFSMPPCSIGEGSEIYTTCDGACDAWILYQGPDCTGGAFASLEEDDCGAGVAPMAALTAPAGQKLSSDALVQNKSVAQTVLQGLKSTVVTFTAIVDGSQKIDSSVDPLLAALDTVIASSNGATRVQYEAVTVAWRARNLAASQKATGARAKIEARLKAWKGSSPNSLLSDWADEALKRVEAAPARPGCSIVGPGRVTSVRRP